MAEYAYNTLGVKNIVMWTDNAMDYTKGLSKYFQDRFTQLGGKLLSDVYMTEDKDFSALVSRLKANPDAQALFASSGPDTAGIIIKQVRRNQAADPRWRWLRHRAHLDGAGSGSVGQCLFHHACLCRSSTPARPTHPRGLSEGLWQPLENAFAALGYDAMGLVADVIKAGLDRSGGDHQGAQRDLRLSGGHRQDRLQGRQSDTEAGRHRV